MTLAAPAPAPAPDGSPTSAAPPRSGTTARATVGVVTLVLVLLTALWAARRIEDDLTARSRAALARAGIPVSVSYDGRDALLTGTVENPREAAEAIGAVSGVAGTQHVTSRLDIVVTDPVGGTRAGTGSGAGSSGSSSGPAAGPTASAPSSGAGTSLPPGTITFPTNDATLSPASTAYLREVSAFLAAHPQAHLVIRGHSDSSGTDEVNWSLSRRRASAVAAYLTAHGIAADRLRTEAYAATSPVAPNDTPAGRAANRRVELAIEEAP